MVPRHAHQNFRRDRARPGTSLAQRRRGQTRNCVCNPTKTPTLPYYPADVEPHSSVAGHARAASFGSRIALPYRTSLDVSNSGGSAHRRGGRALKLDRKRPNSPRLVFFLVFKATPPPSPPRQPRRLSAKLVPGRARSRRYFWCACRGTLPHRTVTI